MSEDVQRPRGGQFVKGQSGNPEGARSRKQKQLLTIDDIHRVILQVAGSQTQMKIEDKSQSITMLERAMWTLVWGKGNRLAAKDVIELARSAGYHFDRIARYPPKYPDQGRQQ